VNHRAGLAIKEVSGPRYHLYGPGCTMPGGACFGGGPEILSSALEDLSIAAFFAVHNLNHGSVWISNQAGRTAVGVGHRSAGDGNPNFL